MKRHLTRWQCFLAACIVLTQLAGMALAADRAPNTLTKKEKADGWRLLFDGKTIDCWRNFRSDKIGDGWKVIDGAIVRAADGAGDIITKDQFDAFELSLEYKISPGGNSGLMFHSTEDEDTPWKTGPEIQIQDNKDGHDPQKSGWLYQIHSSKVDATKPAGEWNELRVLISPEKCTTHMNGVKYYEYIKGGDDWNQRVAKTKFAGMSKFGKPTKGHISLQDHGNPVEFRNIKIRPIEVK